jgi:hypothetical protein
VALPFLQVRSTTAGFETTSNPTVAVTEKKASTASLGGWGILREEGGELPLAAQHPPHRRSLVRRRRFRDAQGGQVTDIWLNIPLLPRRVLTRHSPEWRVGNVRFGDYRVSISGHGGVPTRRGFILQGILIGGVTAVVAMGISQSIITNQWMTRIPAFLVLGAVLGTITFRWWRNGHQP